MTMNNIEKYFKGEMWQCAIGILISVVFISVSVYFIMLQKPLLRGLSYSFLPLSMVLLIICIGVVVRTPKDVERLTSWYESSPQKIRTEELPRMERVIKSFAVIKIAEICLFMAGIVVTVFFWKNELVRGIAIGLILEVAVLYLFDTIAEARGKIYVEFLKSL